MAIFFSKFFYTLSICLFYVISCTLRKQYVKIKFAFLDFEEKEILLFAGIFRAGAVGGLLCVLVGRLLGGGV